MIKICLRACDMIAGSYFGKMNSTLGSVVPLAMFKHNEAFWYICVPHSSVPEIFLLYYLLSSNVFHFDYFVLYATAKSLSYCMLLQIFPRWTP